MLPSLARQKLCPASQHWPHQARRWEPQLCRAPPAHVPAFVASRPASRRVDALTAPRHEHRHPSIDKGRTPSRPDPTDTNLGARAERIAFNCHQLAAVGKNDLRPNDRPPVQRRERSQVGRCPRAGRLQSTKGQSDQARRTKQRDREQTDDREETCAPVASAESWLSRRQGSARPRRQPGRRRGS